MTMRHKSRSVLPGFGLSLGITCTYLSLMVLLPLATIFTRTAELSAPAFWDIVTDPRVVASYRVTFGASFIAALVNTVFGLLVAWVLVRYRFPGRRLVDAMVDLPFALPTAVAGIALTTLYASSGWIGGYLDPFGIQVSYTWLGISVALVFIGLPFVVRTAESPRPMPHTVRLPYISLRVANRLAVTVQSRVAGLVTIGPTTTLRVCSRIWL